MSRALPRAVAVTTAAVVVVGLAATTNAGAAPASSKKAPGIKTSEHQLTKGRTDKSIGGLPKGVPTKGKYAFLLKLDARSTLSVQQSTKSKSAAKKQLTTVKAQQQSVTADLPKGSTVIYRTHAALAGVAVRTDVKNFGKLKGIRGVQAVYPIAPKSLSNSYAVPLQGAPQAWKAYGDRGANSTIAIIDTGIDYTHADFGGPGTVDAYNEAKSEAQQTNPTVFPTAKVIGGTDLVGDDYQADPNSPNYDPVPHPDDNPLDCNDHGSHVAGTSAGLGVNADGSTYDGAYNTNTPFDTMRIGPGMAPEAKLYAFRVFGCEGSTDVVGAAIDKALDPNGDGDNSDEVDVINMSLGSDFGSPQDGDSVAVQNASAKGVTVVVASGNNGDLYDTGGSPGNAPAGIAVAASEDAQSVVDALHVTAPAAIAGDYAAERSIAYDWTTKPDLAGPVVALTDPTNPDGCKAYSDADKALVQDKIVFLEWTDNDAERACGSVARGDFAHAAGASGFIFADDEENFAAGITGSADIPGVLVAKSGGDAIRAQLGTGVTIGGTTANGSTQLDPALNDTLANFSSRGIRGEGNVKPDVTAVGATVFSAGNGTGNQGLTESGTSMATPMVAGVAGLVKSLHRDWSPELVKADIMNTADQDLFRDPNHEGKKYAPNRVGSGRIDVKKALQNNTLAYVTDDGTGVVSASFGPVEVTGDTTLTKTIKVQNTSLASATYDVLYKPRTEIPGAVYSLSSDTVTVGPRSSKNVTLTLTLTKSALTKTIDPTVDRETAGLPRDYVADASGLVVFKGDGVPNLSVPAYAAPRPASTMTQPSSLTLPSGAVQTANLPLTGGRVNQGTGAEKITSTVAGFELQATSPALPTCAGTVTDDCVHFADEKSADLKYVGSTSDAPQLDSIGEDPLTSSNGLAFFSITTQGPWRSPAGFQEYDVYIDSTGDGVADVVTFNTRLTGSDTMVAETVDLNTGEAVDLEGINDRLGDTDTAIFDSNTLVMPVAIGALPGVTASKSRITYSVQSYSGVSGLLDSVGDVADDGTITDGLSMDVLKPGVAVYGSYNGDTSALLYADSPGSVLQIRRDAASYSADKGMGALIVHFHNRLGEKAQVVSFAKQAASVSLTISPNPATKGKPLTGTIKIASVDGIVPTGTVTLRRVTATAGDVGTGPVVDGTGKAGYTPKATGTYTYEGRYSGDANYEAGTSPKVTVKINP